MILILSMGGTIDNLEYNYEDEFRVVQKSIIPKLIKKCRINIPYRIEEVCFKDSKFINKNDLNALAEKCNASVENKIIITHGTLTMIETAKYLMNLNLNKTIILTGSAILGENPNSDALFNLGFAFAQINYLQRGTFITMNGIVFNPTQVKKDIQNNRFVNL